MDCPTARSYFHAFLDNELDVERNLEILRHLACCRSCGGMVEAERRFRGVIEERLGAEPVPEGLADRVLAAVRTSAARGESVETPANGSERTSPAGPRPVAVLAAAGAAAPPFRARAPRFARYAALAAGVLALLYLPWLGGATPFERVAVAAVEAHERVEATDPTQLQFTGSAEEVSAGLRRRFLFQCCCPDLAASGMNLVGAAVLPVSLGRGEASVVRYQCPTTGICVTHIDIPISAVDCRGAECLQESNRTFYLFDIGNRHVVACVGDGLICMFVGSAPRERLIEFFQAAQHTEQHHASLVH